MGNTTEEEKDAISGYFNDPSGIQTSTGSSPSVIGEGGENASVIKFENIQPETEQIEKELSEDDLAKLADEKEIAKLNILKQELKVLLQIMTFLISLKSRLSLILHLQV